MMSEDLKLKLVFVAIFLIGLSVIFSLYSMTKEDKLHDNFMRNKYTGKKYIVQNDTLFCCEYICDNGRYFIWSNGMRSTESFIYKLREVK